MLCSFGDATVNHATALAAINTARYAVRLGLPMPILFVCEDNETGISVPTPEGWIASSFGHLEHLRYDLAEGEIDEVWDTHNADLELAGRVVAAGFERRRKLRRQASAGGQECRKALSLFARRDNEFLVNRRPASTPALARVEHGEGGGSSRSASRATAAYRAARAAHR